MMETNTNMNIEELVGKGFSLKRLDHKSIQDHENEVRLVLTERNERTRLPYILRYYRELGITKFFVIDDKSTDGSREYLLEQEDCFLFEPTNTFGESKAGVDWQNLLLDKYATGHWVIVSDADELLAYPNMETVKLPELCSYLDQEGSTALFAFLLDMYPKESLSTGLCLPDKPFFEICPYFDADYIFREKRTFSSQINELPRTRVIGGPRMRKFYPRQNHVDFLNRLLNTLAIKLSERLKFINRDKPHYAPALIKLPLIKWNKEIKKLTSHIISAPNGTKISNVTGAIMHFKFFADFHEKARTEVARGEHFGGSLEYKRYLNYTKKEPEMVLYYQGSKKFENSASLLDAGLIKTSQNFETYCKNKRSVREV